MTVLEFFQTQIFISIKNVFFYYLFIYFILFLNKTLMSLQYYSDIISHVMLTFEFFYISFMFTICLSSKRPEKEVFCSFSLLFGLDENSNT